MEPTARVVGDDRTAGRLRRLADRLEQLDLEPAGEHLQRHAAADSPVDTGTVSRTWELEMHHRSGRVVNRTRYVRPLLARDNFLARVRRREHQPVIDIVRDSVRSLIRAWRRL